MNFFFVWSTRIDSLSWAFIYALANVWYLVPLLVDHLLTVCGAWRHCLDLKLRWAFPQPKFLYTDEKNNFYWTRPKIHHVDLVDGSLVKPIRNPLMHRLQTKLMASMAMLSVVSNRMWQGAIVLRHLTKEDRDRSVAFLFSYEP